MFAIYHKRKNSDLHNSILPREKFRENHSWFPKLFPIPIYFIINIKFNFMFKTSGVCLFMNISLLDNKSDIKIYNKYCIADIANFVHIYIGNYNKELIHNFFFYYSLIF